MATVSSLRSLSSAKMSSLMGLCKWAGSLVRLEGSTVELFLLVSSWYSCNCLFSSSVNRWVKVVS